MACVALPTPTSPEPRIRTTMHQGYNSIFQPPSPQLAAPSISADNHATPDYFTQASRKRPRTDTLYDNRITSHVSSPEVQTPAWTRDSHVYSVENGEFSANPLNVNDRYRLRDGFDTPGLIANTDLYTESDTDDNCRRAIRDQVEYKSMTEPALGGPLGRERNGQARIHAFDKNSSQTSSPSWTRFALTLPISIAGKVFSFGSTVFKGFYAGEGAGYDLQTQVRSSRPRISSRETPVPGSWRDSPPANGNNRKTSYGFEGDFEQDNPATPRRPYPNKRRHTDKDEWVMVENEDAEPSPQPRTKPAYTRPSRPTAHRMTSRRSMLTHSRRASYNTSTGSPITSPQRLEFPSDTSLRRSLAAHPSSPKRPSSSSHNAFPSPEAERFAKRQAKQDRAVDRHMNSMSRQLQELIRQGQEALGTGISIEGNDDEDEGFVDDE